MKEAIFQKRVIAFAYTDAKGEATQRSAYPVKLLFKSRSWYLQAFCLGSQSYRTFKLVRMRQVVVLEEIFALAKPAPPKAEAAQTTLPALGEVTLRFFPHAAYRAFDEFDEGHMAFQEDGSVVVTVALPQDEWLYQYLLSLGTAAEVVQPQSVRQELLQRLKAIQQMYGKKI